MVSLCWSRWLTCPCIFISLLKMSFSGNNSKIATVTQKTHLAFVFFSNSWLRGSDRRPSWSSFSLFPTPFIPWPNRLSKYSSHTDVCSSVQTHSSAHYNSYGLLDFLMIYCRNIGEININFLFFFLYFHVISCDNIYGH